MRFTHRWFCLFCLACLLEQVQSGRKGSTKHDNEENTCQGLVQFRYYNATTLIQQALRQIDSSHPIFSNKNEMNDIDLTFAMANLLAPPSCILVDLGEEFVPFVIDALNDLNGSIIGWVDATKPFAHVYQDDQNGASIKDRRNGWTSTGINGQPINDDYWAANEPHLTDYATTTEPLRDVVKTAAVYVLHHGGLVSVSPHQGQVGAYYQCCYGVSMVDMLGKSQRRVEVLRKILAEASREAGNTM